MTIPNSAIKYGLGLTYVNDSDTWKPVKSAWITDDAGQWKPIKTGWVRHEDGTWQRIYPTPTGVFTSSPIVTNSYYQHYADKGTILAVTNIGDYDLIINSAVFNDAVGVTTLANISTQFPVTLAPGKTTNLKFYVTGNTVGTYSGNIQFINYIGYLGYGNVTVDHTVTVLPDYADITLETTDTTLTTHYLQDSVTYNQYSYGSNTITVSPGINSLKINMSGAGGGGGGADTYTGGSGYNGHNLTGVIPVTSGDTISVYVGGGGGAGGSHTTGGAGAAGASSIGYSGGRGGNAGPTPHSGAGGGGGGATVIKKNGTVVAVAAGGGGGGGGGNYGGPGGQYIQYTSGTAGTQGTDRSGDGGGAGGGGGGYQGGIGGDLNGSGDRGGFAGSDGSDLVPAGWTVSRASNYGPPYVAGGDGTATIVASGLATSAAKQFTIRNSGNGGTLTFSNISVTTGVVAVSNLLSNNVGFDFSTFTGESTQFTVTPYGSLPPGVYKDTIVVRSNAKSTPVLSIPVTVRVEQPNGHTAFTSPNTYQWVVPENVSSINTLTVGAGGGGGAALYVSTFGAGNAGGGGGGSGGYVYNYAVAVTPGETLTIGVGAGGNPGGITSRTVLYAVTCPGWGSFLNTYGVWVNPNGQDPVNYGIDMTRTWAASAGTYTMRASADDYAYFYVDGVDIGHSVATWQTSDTFTFTVGSGFHEIRIYAVNTGGPGGFGAAIYDSGNNLVWHTRQVLDPNAGQIGPRSFITGSFGTISAGGGGAGGGASGVRNAELQAEIDGAGSITAGAGGSGGSPNGVAGSDGQAVAGAIRNLGGVGGNNSATVAFGSDTFGPYGAGGAGGGEASHLGGSSGNPGGVVIWWGNGLNS